MLAASAKPTSLRLSRNKTLEILMRLLFARGTLKPSIALLLAIASTTAAHAQYVKPHIEHASYGEVKVVVPVTASDPAVWSFKLHNLANGIDASKESGGNLQARVVLYGPGVKLLARPMSDDLKAAVDQLRASGVRFEICNNTLKGMDLDWHALYDVHESDIVAAGFLEVGWLANQGWAVEAMN
jgi:intracellular sulfur oxidation DsrE/DsrF family protein